MDKWVLKNSVWLWGSQIISKLLGFFYTIYLAKNLGVTEFGLFSLALTYFSVFTALTDFGFTRFLTREIAQDTTNIHTVLYRVGILRVALVLVFSGIFISLLSLLDQNSSRVGLIIVALVSVIPLSIGQTIDAAFVALKKLNYSGMAQVILSSTNIILALFFIHSGWGLYGAIISLFLGHVIYACLLIYLLLKQNLSLRGSMNMNDVVPILKETLPYGAITILGFLFFKVDTLLLAYLKGNYDTGIYSVGYRFFEGVNVIPGAVSVALFPIMASFHNRGHKAVYDLYQRWIKIAFLIAVPFTVAFIFFIPILIDIYLPAYRQSIDVVRILGLCLPFVFLTAPQGALFLSTEKYLKIAIWISTFNLAFNLIGNWILIPKMSYIGASYITLASYVEGFLVFYVVIKLLFERKKSDGDL